MIQRTLFRQSRALSSFTTSSSRTAATTPLSKPQFRTAPNFSAVSASSRRALGSFSGRRWYSSEPEAKKEGEETTKENDKAAAEEDPVKKELEAKNKEIIELKVCLVFCIS